MIWSLALTAIIILLFLWFYWHITRQMKYIRDAEILSRTTERMNDFEDKLLERKKRQREELAKITDPDSATLARKLRRGRYGKKPSDS